MTTRTRGRPRHPDVLTPAEWAVLDLVRHGLTQREIAERSGVSRDAVKYHVENIAGKLGVRGSRELRHWPGIPATGPLARWPAGGPI